MPCISLRISVNSPALSHARLTPFQLTAVLHFLVLNHPWFKRECRTTIETERVQKAESGMHTVSWYTHRETTCKQCIGMHAVKIGPIYHRARPHLPQTRALWAGRAWVKKTVACVQFELGGGGESQLSLCASSSSRVLVCPLVEFALHCAHAI